MQSLEFLRFPDTGMVVVLVVDNGSSDGTIDLLLKANAKKLKCKNGKLPYLYQGGTGLARAAMQDATFQMENICLFLMPMSPFLGLPGV